MIEPLVLHSYWRSSASWRVRIALAIKGLEWQGAYHHLARNEQQSPAYRALNPQALVPALEVGAAVLTQSLAICEYLEETHPSPPLLPATALERARVRAFAQAIACEVHPLQNLRVLRMLRAKGFDQTAVDDWARDVIESGLAACAALVENETGPFCFGSQIGLADIFLVPQMTNARRFGARTDFGRLNAIEAACLALPVFAETAAAMQADADPA